MGNIAQRTGTVKSYRESPGQCVIQANYALTDTHKVVVVEKHVSTIFFLNPAV